MMARAEAMEAVEAAVVSVNDSLGMFLPLLILVVIGYFVIRFNRR